MERKIGNFLENNINRDSKKNNGCYTHFCTKANYDDIINSEWEEKNLQECINDINGFKPPSIIHVYFNILFIIVECLAAIFYYPQLVQMGIFIVILSWLCPFCQLGGIADCRRLMGGGIGYLTFSLIVLWYLRVLWFDHNLFSPL